MIFVMNILECISGKEEFTPDDAERLLDGMLKRTYSPTDLSESDERNPFMLESFVDFSKTSRSASAICLDIGGTNIRSAKASFDKNGEAILQGCISERIGKDIDSFDKLIEEMARRVRLTNGAKNDLPDIRICFSHPFKSIENGDAEIIFLSKDTGIRGAEGKIIGKPLRQALGSDLKGSIKIINDTVASLIHAKYALAEFDFGNALVYGVVVGTGTNIALCRDGKEIVNTEIGQFPIILESDGNSKAVFEHITGGKYICRTIRKALRGNRLVDSAKTAEELGEIAVRNSIESIEIRNAIENAARIEAACLGAIIRYQMRIESKCRAVASIGGSIYEKLPFFKEAFDEKIGKIAKDLNCEMLLSMTSGYSNLIAAAM
ncbi:MAG TPA: hypothetical protein DCO86_03690, partial [Spirochaetaceae bacterium]|nr:hypothetical protein [Spirochaetaceae bacterium]